MFDKGFFNGLFDFNRDGKLDAFERAADFAAFQEMMNEKETSDEVTDFEEEEELDELQVAGLDYDELEFMDEDERNEALLDAGLEPDDFDF